MKKITFLSFILIFIISSSVQAGEWSYEFVVWDGKVYEVKQEELIVESEIGKKIGKVKTQPYSDNRSSAMRYYGNASNVYPVGTPYYEIKGLSTSTTIAVKVDNGWVRANYIKPAPFHVINIITNPTIILTAIIIIGWIIFKFFYRLKD